MRRVTHQETRRDRAHTRQVRDSGTTAQDQHGRNDNVRGQPEEQEHDMGELAPSSANDFKEAAGKLISCWTTS